MAVSPVIKTSIDGSILLEDGTTPTAVSLTLPFTNGDFGATQIKKLLNESVAIEGRGKLRSVRPGARIYPQLSFTCQLSQFTAASSPGDVLDFILAQGPYASNESTLAGGVHCVDLTFTIEGTDLGDSADHTVTFSKVDVQFDFSESQDGNTVSITGTVYGTITGDLAAAGLA